MKVLNKKYKFVKLDIYIYDVEKSLHPEGPSIKSATLLDSTRLYSPVQADHSVVYGNSIGSLFITPPLHMIQWIIIVSPNLSASFLV